MAPGMCPPLFSPPAIQSAAKAPYIDVMTFARPNTRDRMKAALGVAAFHALLGYAFIVGLAVHVPVALSDDLKIFDISLPPAPPVPPKTPARHERSRKRAGAASPPNLKAKATDVVAPLPVVRLEAPPPLVSAPTPSIGEQRSLGAAPIPGPGTGSGGRGIGTGSGGSGDGEGDGGETTPHQIRGRLKNSDYPQWAAEANIGGTVSVRFSVQIDGRATDCFVTRSSGSARLDDYTCGLIEQRYRFKPSRDRYGKPVRSAVIEDHTWEIDRDEPPRP